MRWDCKKRRDGSVEVKMIVTSAELETIQSAMEGKDDEGLSQIAFGFVGGLKPPKIKPPKLPKIKPPQITPRRKARYCITCGDGTRHNIQAYGDVHAIAIGAAKCGSFSMQNGRCKEEEVDE